MINFERYSQAAFLHELLSSPVSGSDTIPADVTKPAGEVLLSEEQAAKVAGVSRKTICRLIKAGRLEAVNFGTGRKHKYRIKPEALAALQSTPTVRPQQPRQRRQGGQNFAGKSLRDLLPDV